MSENEKHRKYCRCNCCNERKWGHRAILKKRLRLDKELCLITTLYIDRFLVDPLLITFLKEHYGDILGVEYTCFFGEEHIKVEYSEVKKLYAHKPSLFTEIQNTNPNDIEIEDDCELVDAFVD